MEDQNYWKKKYQNIWRYSTKMEKKVLNLVKKNGITGELSGFGSGSTEFIRGDCKTY